MVAALTILRAHALAGWPAVPGRAELGSFEDWDRLVAGAIAFAGGADIVALLERTRAADPERDSLAEVLRMLQGVGATRPMKAGEIIREVEKRKAEAPNNALNGEPGQGSRSNGLTCCAGLVAMATPIPGAWGVTSPGIRGASRPVCS